MPGKILARMMNTVSAGGDWRHTITPESLRAAIRDIGEMGPKSDHVGEMRGLNVFNLTEARVQTIAVGDEHNPDQVKGIPAYEDYPAERLDAGVYPRLRFGVMTPPGQLYRIHTGDGHEELYQVTDDSSQMIVISSGATGAEPQPGAAPEPATAGGAAMGGGVAQAVKWARPLSHDRLTLADGDATATKAWQGKPRHPAALVAVGRGGGAEGFALAAVVEAMPKAYGSAFSFGVGRAMPKEGQTFGYGADGTCGLVQNTGSESDRHARTKGFGRRADRDDRKLGAPIVQGSRLALHLSPRGVEGTRTARFFVDKEEVAVFVDIEDDGDGSDWVAGVTLSDNASVRLVPAEGVELQ
eukprot:COSAG04_NODE_4153_length_2266_cov_4.369635_1_plen_355_part_00